MIIAIDKPVISHYHPVMATLHFSIKLKNRISDLEKIRAAVSNMSASIDCTHRKFKEINLVLEELFTNVVKYGFTDDREHEINLSLSCDDTAVSIRMEDDGEPFDPTAQTAPDTRCAIEKRCVGGLGIHFVKHFIDECRYSRKKGRNIIELKKNIFSEEPVQTDSMSK